MNFIKNNLKYILVILFLFFAYAFTYSYISQETPLYACDFVEQNIFWHDFAQMLIKNPLEFFSQISHDIYWHNRNPFSILPILPFAFILKGYRLGFLFAVEAVYMLPVVLLTWHIFNRFFLSKQKNEEQEEKLPFKKRKLLMFLSSMFFFPAIWISVLLGMPDICGMISILLCYIIYFKFDFTQKTKFTTLILFAVLLYLSFLSRRWYSVVILTFFASIIIENIIIYLKNSEILKKIGYTLLNLGIVSSIICLFAFIIQGGYFRNIIQSEMMERAAFSFDFNQWYTITLGHLGILICLIALIGLIFNYKNKLVRFSALNIIIYASVYIIVMKNQFLWVNHYIYIAILMCILFCTGAYTIVEFIKNNKLRNIFIALIVIYNLFNFYTFFLIERPQKLNFLFPETTAYPINSPDYYKIKDLYSYLENEYNKDNSIKVGIYGICNSFGYWQLRSINPDNDFAKKAIGFERILNSDFDDAAYDENFVILFRPLGIYAPDELSTKIKEIGKMFEENTGIAQDYEEVKTLQLSDENNTKIILYKRKTK